MARRATPYLLSAALACSLALAAQPPPEPGPAARPRVLRLDVKQAITSGTAEYIEAGIARARAEGHDLLLIVLDTPGGHLDATRDIVQTMLGSAVPIAVWVGPAGARAGSAGVFITLAAHVAAMHPASNIGAAHPVLSGGKDVAEEAGKDMAKKVENDTAAFARGIAKARGRNIEWAEKAVRESVSVTADEAVNARVVDVVAPDPEAVLAFADGRTAALPAGPRAIRSRDAVIEPLAMTVRQRTLSFLADPNVVAMLFLVGTLGIALEFYHPGSVIPGAAGALCLLLAFLAMRVIPVNAGAVILLLAGVALLVAEGYVTTHGIAGAAGALCVLLGTMLFIDKGAPEYRFDPAAFELSPAVVWPTPLALAAVLGFVAWKVGSSRRGRLVSGAPGLVGETGEALGDLGPEGGNVFVHGEYWRARSSGPLPRGSRVRVVAVEGLVLRVEPAGGPPPALQGTGVKGG
jgi:membrane-bound serine protease (ClpP class)